MGFFDKIKNKVAQATGQQQDPQAHAEAQPQQAWTQAPHTPSEVDDLSDIDNHGDTEFDPREPDEWGGWDPNDWQGYWYRVKTVEEIANTQGDAAADAKCREFGLRDASHMQEVSSTFYRHFGEQPAFTQACLDAMNRMHRDKLGAAAQGNQQLFEPVEGVSLELYATTQAKAATMGGDTSKWGQILAAAGMDQAKWDRVSAEWNRRMSGQAGDMNATMAVITEYSKYFGQAGMGQYGGAAAANAGNAGIYGNSQTGAVGAEPCTLERYAEIGGAQSAWAQQGRDVNAMLQQQFGMTALDWSNLSQYWSAKFSSDYTIAGRYGELLDYYTQQYLAASGGGPANQDSDIDI